MPSLDDLSDLGPPISDSTGRIFVLSTAAAFIYVTGYTARGRFLRWMLLSMFTADVYLLLTMPDLMGHVAGFDPLIANFVVADLFRVVDLYFVRDYSRLAAAEAKKEDEPSKVLAQLRAPGPPPGLSRFSSPWFGAFDFLIMNHRNVGTPFQVKAVPRFSESRPQHVPSRARFMAWKLLVCAAAYLTLDVLTCAPAPDAALYAADKDHVFRRWAEVTPEELQMRFLTAFNLWASTWLLIQYLYAIIAVACVGLRIYEPADFPPLTGSWANSYTVRSHWSRTWHQVLQAPYLAVAKLGMDAFVPRVWHRNLAGRYARNTFVFLISGVAHLVSPLGSTGGSEQFRGTFVFFPLQTLGLVIEDAAIALYKKVTGRHSAGWWAYALGYLWVIVWMTWSVPIWVYPTLRRGGEGMVPYSFIRGRFQSKELWEY